MRSRLRPLAVALGLVFLTLPLPALAQDDGDDRSIHRTGPYLGLGVTGLLPIFDIDEPGLNPDEESSVGVVARAGYRLHEHWAVELHYEHVDGMEISGVLQTGEVRADVLTVNARGIVPTVTDASLYGLLGFGFSAWEGHNPTPGFIISGTEYETAWRAGVGIEYAFDEHWVLNLEASGVGTFQRILDEYIQMVSVGAGIQYRF